MEPLHFPAEAAQALTTIALGIQKLEIGFDNLRQDVAQINSRISSIDEDLREHTLDDSKIQTNIHNQLLTLRDEATHRRGNRIPQYALVLSICSFALTTLTTISGIIFQFVKFGGQR